jgi:hypothetical protein
LPIVQHLLNVDPLGLAMRREFPDLDGFFLAKILGYDNDALCLTLHSNARDKIDIVYIYLYEYLITHADFECSSFFPRINNVTLEGDTEKSRWICRIDFESGNFTISCSNFSTFELSRPISDLGGLP